MLSILLVLASLFVPFIIFCLVVVLALVIYVIAVRNSLKQTEVKISESLSDVDVALTKRYDTLTKMMDVVKSHTNYERSVLLETIKLRQGMSMEERQDVAAQMDEAKKDIMFHAEAYPQLLASESYKQLQIAIMDTEEHLQAARRAYNANISAFNRTVVSFPSSLIAKMFHMSEMEFFQAEDKKREDVKIDI